MTNAARRLQDGGQRQTNIQKVTAMTHKLFLSTTAVALLGLGTMPLFANQMPVMQMPAASQTDQSQSSPDAEMTNHQNEMQTLFAKLQTSFQAVVNARDGSGFVRDKSIIRAHEADLTELQNAVRNHKLLVVSADRKSDVNSKQHDAMMQHQQQMKAALYDVADTFYVYMQANDRSNDFAESVTDTLNAHRHALKELEDAIAQQERAMSLMKTTPDQGEAKTKKPGGCM